MENLTTSRTILFIRAFLYQITFLLSVIVLGTLIILFFFRSVDFRLKIVKSWSSLNLWLLKVICKLDFVLEGSEHLTEQNAIVLCKHQSTWETIALNNIIPLGRWVFKRELLFIPFFGWALALTSPICINRSAGRKAASQIVSKGTRILQQGKWLIIFPEGTRAKPGTEKKYKIGGALLAEKSGYPVLPIAHNAGEFWPKHSFIKWPGTITISIGPMINTENKTAREILSETHEWIETKTQQISEPLRLNR
ncbi:MAG: 1-acyl-sn-glycerol-3-phosphate acyltransferase [Thiotrichaceae bacterium]|nr:MAG: 1-acyl-sn-glycerol-3-phosphate acyltransferase [Thiotrichaceae bacterium]